MVVILKILITKSTTLSDDLFLCQVSKGSAVQSEFKNFCTLVTMVTAAILNFCNPKNCHTLRWIFLQNFMKFDERNPIFFFNPPFFVSMATAAKFVLPIPILLVYLVPLDVDVTGNITAKFVKFGVNLTFFAPWLPWQRPPF